MSGSFKKVDTKSPGMDRMLNAGFMLRMKHDNFRLETHRMRLSGLYPRPDKRELNEIITESRSAMRFGQDTFYKMPGKMEHPFDFDRDKFALIFRAKYPWVNDENISSFVNRETLLAMR